MAHKVEAWVGLVWITNVDPTIGLGVAAPLWQPMIRTDNSTFYYKSGAANTDWTVILGGGGPSGIAIEDNGAPILAAATTINVHSPLVATDEGGNTAGISLPAGQGIVTPIVYVATGAEDPAGFPVTLAPAQPDTNYFVWAQCGGVTFQLTFDIPVADYLVASFTCIPSAPLTAGDKIIFFLVHFTP